GREEKLDLHDYCGIKDPTPYEAVKKMIREDKILELRSKRNTLWEQTKAFLEEHRGENGLVAADAVEQYNKMAKEVKDLGAEIERLEQQMQIDALMAAPTSVPVHGNPKAGAPKDKDIRPTATEEYKNAFWDMIRAR